MCGCLEVCVCRGMSECWLAKAFLTPKAILSEGGTRYFALVCGWKDFQVGYVRLFVMGKYRMYLFSSQAAC